MSLVNIRSRHRSLLSRPTANLSAKNFSAAGGPVMVKLRFEREKPRESGNGFILVAEESELEVHASEGLEIFKFQVQQASRRVQCFVSMSRVSCLPIDLGIILSAMTRSQANCSGVSAGCPFEYAFK